MPGVLELRKWKQKKVGFKASLSYIVGFKPEWAIWERPCL